MDHKIYLKDHGISKNGNHFYFNKSGIRVTDTKILERLSKFRVPPAWKSVWYSSNKNCHIQVHGIDASGKKQYILSEEWINNSKYSKYNRMKSFITNINNFKKKINLNNFKHNYEFIIKLLFNLLIDTHIRVGNEKYAENNKTYGLTTLRQKHLINRNGIFYFSFVGKSKIEHTIEVPREYNIYLKKLNVLSNNKPLFWYPENGNSKEVNSEQLNQFLKENMGKEYTCKDFRTYSANVLFIKAFLKNCKKERYPPKKIILESIDSSAKELGHSRNICKKSYISTNLLDYCLDSFNSACLLNSSVLLSKIS